MKQTQTHIPKFPQLRFPGFVWEWGEESISKLYPKVRNGFVGVATPFYVEEGVKYLQGKNIKSNSIDSRWLIYINEDFHSNKKNSQLKVNDIVMVQSWHIWECAVITSEYENWNCHALIVMTPKEEINSNFFVYYFYSDFWKKEIYKITTWNTIKHILTSDLKQVIVSTPSFLEQQKIADFLSTVDSRIENLKAKKKTLEEYKKWVMQKIFSQELRFKDENGENFEDWEEKKLGDMCEVKKWVQLNKDNLLNDAKYPAINWWIEPSGYTDNYNKDANTITVSEGWNSCWYVNFIQTKFWSGWHCYTLENLQLGVLYLYQFLKYNEWNIMNLRVGSGLPNIQKKDINNYKVMFSSPSEQQKIADFLSEIDEKIENESERIERAEEWKRGLLQKMFV